MIEENRCKKCGNCCRQGGPALHKRDLSLVVDGIIPISSLLTIRKGELVHNPLTGTLQPAGVELIKIRGKGRQWECFYYGENTACTIYKNRPQACVIFKCWDTEEVLALIEKDTLSRFDILGSDDPLIPLITAHESTCSCPDFLSIRVNGSRLPAQQQRRLEEQVRGDLHFRARVTAEFNLSLQEELFYFGRPLFQQLQPLGAIIRETQSGVTLRWKI